MLSDKAKDLDDRKKRYFGAEKIKVIKKEEDVKQIQKQESETTRVEREKKQLRVDEWVKNNAKPKDQMISLRLNRS